MIRNFLEDPDVEDVEETSSRDTEHCSPCVIIVIMRTQYSQARWKEILIRNFLLDVLKIHQEETSDRRGRQTADFQRETEDFLQTRLLAKLKEILLINFLPEILKIHHEDFRLDSEDKTEDNQKTLLLYCVIIVIMRTQFSQAR